MLRFTQSTRMASQAFFLKNIAAVCEAVLIPPRPPVAGLLSAPATLNAIKPKKPIELSPVISELFGCGSSTTTKSASKLHMSEGKSSCKKKKAAAPVQTMTNVKSILQTKKKAVASTVTSASSSKKKAVVLSSTKPAAKKAVASAKKTTKKQQKTNKKKAAPKRK